MEDRATLIFDGDDTLWSTQPLYDAAKEALYQLVADAGLSEADARAEFDALDLANVERLGFSPERFPLSMREMIGRLTARAGRPADEALEAEAARIGRSVFQHTPVLDPEAPAVLKGLGRTYRLVLYTMGDSGIQHRRIEALELHPLFDHVVVTEDKSADTLQNVIIELSLTPRSTWYIGNSLRSDIAPALEVGLRPIWLVRQTWAYDHGPTPPPEVPIIHSLVEIPAVVGVTSASR